MRKLVKGLATLILLPLLLAALVYAAYWYQVKSFLDRVRDDIAPVAQLSYGSIYANPLGEIGADNLQLVLNRQGARIPIQSLRLRSKDPLFFLNPQSRIEAGDWPDALTLTVSGVDLDLASPLFKMLQQQAEEAMPPGQVSPEALGCGSVERFDLPVLRRMGYSRLALDFTVGLYVDRPNRRITLESGADVGNMGNSLTRLEFSVASDNLAPAQILAANPRLRHLEVSYQDTGHNLRRNNFCAREAGVEVAEYRQLHETLIKQEVAQLGVQLPASLWQLYLGSTQPRVNLLFTMDPPGGLGAEVMAGVSSPQYLLDRLNIGVKMNGQALALDHVNIEQMFAGLAEGQAPVVPDGVVEAPANTTAGGGGAVVGESAAEVLAAEVALAEAAALAVEGVAVAAEAMSEDDLLRGMPKRKAAVVKAYQPTALTELDQLVGHPVRVYTDLGNRMDGRLVAANGSQLRLESRVDKGLVQYPLDYTQVRRVEVYR